ncbi:hypothetical protein R1sor_012490 [Riccia sorocarpa]|uniref:Thioredoxin domain-containing protein n=1 Tax=Riccia sorocarpa TaxID=122646 RepID=A0ABD3I774_9MARC
MFLPQDRKQSRTLRVGVRMAAGGLVAGGATALAAWSGASAAAGVTRARTAAQGGALAGRASRGTEVDFVEGGLKWTQVQVSVSRKGTSRGAMVVVRAEAGGEVSTATVASAKADLITEVDKDTFWPIVKSAGEKLVVLDMYTQWCGPCKLILPKIQALAATLDDVIFCKLDCNQANKPLAKELGIKVVPTFKIFKNGEVVTTITGAKYDNLVAAIQSAREGQ